MSTDRMTTYLGVAIGALHQAGVVGTLPSSKTEWMQTGLSVGFALLGFMSNKITVKA